MNSETVITRFPPSPTGNLHIGSVRTALFNYIYAKKHKGAFYIRMEDTDRARSRKEFEDDIIESFKWLGIEGAGPVVRQSERGEIYQRYIEQLISDGYAYVSEEQTLEGKSPTVIRFKNPHTKVAFEDTAHGEIEVDVSDLGDFVIARSVAEPLYHLAVVIDDHEFSVTHIIRGTDHLSNTPRQILLQEAIGAKRPIYTHIPMVLGSDKSKLSKRHSAKSTLEYRDDGYLPEALINFLMLIGWHPSENEQEIFSLDELIQMFELEDVQKAPGVFDIEKLNWVNREHVRRMEPRVFKTHVLKWLPEDAHIRPQWSEERLERAIPMIQERTTVLKDIWNLYENGDLEFLFEKPEYFAESLIWKESSKEEARVHLLEAITHFNGLPELFSPEEIKDRIWKYAEVNGKGNVLWPLRFALSGLERSADPFTIASILGREESISRIKQAIEIIDKA